MDRPEKTLTGRVPRAFFETARVLTTLSGFNLGLFRTL